ncbi:hypothetical protein J5N97_014187 [Dioscorea zingiberensis]|uniref:Uncharacterized protein n=1 Tax=Dioscorea zingiberensis TaxID=325984 RepID=A0A9D5CUN3_9LILI|nr:hypothetical protein J5N97_014187 [Dioscorea zingiberensis]
MALSIFLNSRMDKTIVWKSNLRWYYPVEKGLDETVTPHQHIPLQSKPPSYLASPPSSLVPPRRQLSLLPRLISHPTTTPLLGVPRPLEATTIFTVPRPPETSSPKSDFSISSSPSIDIHAGTSGWHAWQHPTALFLYDLVTGKPPSFLLPSQFSLYQPSSSFEQELRRREEKDGEPNGTSGWHAWQHPPAPFH